ncbi:MAG: hypothetical protein IKV16_01480, partial [Clostridia bacterium]|nr:hypothetical protein [Clostridia bacterium]
ELPAASEMADDITVEDASLSEVQSTIEADAIENNISDQPALQISQEDNESELADLSVINEEKEIVPADPASGNDTSNPPPTKNKVKSIRDVFRNRILANALLCATSILLLITVLFAPLCRSSVAVSSKNTVDVRFSGIDAVKLLVCSANSMTDEQIVKSELYTKTQKLSRSVNLSSSRLSDGKLEIARTILKNNIYITLASERTAARPAMFFASGVLVAFAIVSLIFLCKSTASLIRAITAQVKYGKPVKRQERAPVCLLWSLLSMTPLLSYSFLQMADWGYSTSFAVYSAAGYGLSYGILAIVILTVLVGTYFFISSLVADSSDEEVISKKERRKKLLFLGLVLLLLISVFLPLFRVEAGNILSSNTDSFGLALSDIGIMGDGDSDFFFMSSGTSFTEELKSSAKKATLSKSDFTAEKAFDTLLFGVADIDVRGLYIPIQIFTYAILIFLVFLFTRAIRIVAFAEKYTAGTATLKTFSCIFVIINAIFELILFFIAKFSAISYLSTVLSVGIGIGFFLALISMIGLFTLSPRVASRGAYSDQWYDNADVSYAPYVVRKTY